MAPRRSHQRLGARAPNRTHSGRHRECLRVKRPYRTRRGHRRPPRTTPKHAVLQPGWCRMRRRRCQLPGRVVLIVDDDEDFSDACVDFLQSRGFTCVVARDGVEALDYLLRVPTPSVVLTDLRMPRMDGEQLRQVIEQTPAWSKIPVILWSSEIATPRGPAGLQIKARDLGEVIRVLQPYVA